MNYWKPNWGLVKVANEIQATSTKTIENDLKEALQPMFPHFSISVHPFGSRVLGLANPHSDLDIYVRCYAEFIEYTERPLQMVLKNLECIAIGIRNSNKWHFMRKLMNGKCPIVVAKHLQTKIRVDISLINEMTFKQNVLMKYMFDLQPIARYMAIFVRHLIKEKKIKKLRSFVLNLLVIYYLQIENKLPSAKELLNKQPSNSEPWITEFNRYNLSRFGMNKIQPNAESVHLYIQDFFQFYANFNYEELVICPYLGNYIYRHELRHQMPDIFGKYYNPKNWSGSMVVQDLLYLSQNKTKSISLIKVKSFKDVCREYSS